MAEQLEGTLDEEIKPIDFGALFEGSELSDEIKDKVKTIFESALAEKVATEVELIKEDYEAKFDASLDEIKAELVESIDTFLNYAVEEWVQENKLAVESGLRTEIAESFITGLKGLFLESFIEVPEEKYDLVAEMEEETATLKASLDEQIAKNAAAAVTISNLIKESVFTEVADGLALTDKDRLKTLAEGVEFGSEQEYKEKLLTIKENYWPKTPAPKTNTSLDESFDDSNGVIINANVKRYAEALNRVRF